MHKNRLNHLAFALVVSVLLFVIGRNLYRHYQEKALEDAVNGDDAEAVALIKQGVYANDPKKLESLLIAAIRNNKPNIMHLLLDKVDVRGHIGGKALGIAINQHNLTILRLLLDRGVNVNLKNGFGDTLLMQAVLNDSKDAVKLLLERGADVNAIYEPATATKPSATALDAALSYHHNAIALILIATKINQTTKNKALNVAVETGNAEIVQCLLAARARPDFQSREWIQAVSTAKSNHKQYDAAYVKVLQLLRPLGVKATPSKAELESRNSSGQTPLLLALSHNDTVEAQRLLAQGAEVNVVDKIGETPLMEAIEHNSPLISSLLAKGADPNIMTAIGITPLLQALQSNNVPLMRRLLAHGANPNLHRPHLSSILDRARKHQQKEMIALLQNAGAK